MKQTSQSYCSGISLVHLVKISLLALALLAGAAGCETAQSSRKSEGSTASWQPSSSLSSSATNSAVASVPTKPSEQLLLREGDTVRISFPGAATLNTVQQIRRDGNITLPLVGEYKAAGLALAQVEKELVKLYDPHLQVKEVTVAMDASTFAVYVTGSVLRPGKITSDRPISALEAVVEAGIDYTRANLNKVRIIRQENGRSVYYNINLKQAIEGKPAESFDLKPSDIIFVPERFAWF